MDTNILIRVAWYDRETDKYDYGSWKHFKLIKEMKDWVYKQNRSYPKIRYWIEYKEGYDRDAFTRNFEIDLNEGDVAAFKGAIIKIHSATNVSIIYEVMRNFQS